MKKILITTLVAVLCLPSILMAQTRTVTGKVLDAETGEPVPFASVAVKGSTTLGTYTLDDGTFSLPGVPQDATTLIASFVGYQDVEVPIGNGVNLTITLEPDALFLDQVVVTALGIQRQSKEIGYSAAKVSSEDLNTTQNSDATQALIGKVSGLQISAASASLDAEVRINLRGSRSFLGDNQPLLVVDGVPTPLDFLQSMNPNDIDNISVLKGGSAAALYGSSAANGVLYVTTKTGEKGRPRITYALTTTFDKASYFPKYQKRFGPGAQEEHGFGSYIQGENQQYGPEFDGSIVPIGSPFMDEEGVIHQLEEVYSFKEGARESYYDTGIGIQNDISFSSGGDNGNFFVSYQNVHRTGTVAGDVMDRNTVRFNASRIYKSFTARVNFSYANMQGDFNNSSSNGLQALWNTPGHINLPEYKDWRNVLGGSPDQWVNDYYQNPYAQIDIYRREFRRDRFTGAATLEWAPLKWLRFMGRVGMNTNVSNTSSRTNAWHYNDYAKTSGRSYATSDIYSTFYTYAGLSQRLNADVMAFAEHQFNKNFGIKGMVGWSMNSRYEESKNVEAGQLALDNLFNVSNKVGELVGANSITQIRTQSVYASVDFNILGWIYLQVTGRNDWTSLLDKSNWSFFYPGANMSLMLSDAIPALKNSSWLSYLKLRGTFAKVGTVNVGAYRLDNMAEVADPFPFGALTSYEIDNSIRNRYLNPEFTTEFEVGLEVGFLKDRITFEAAYYHQNTTGQTVNVSIPYSTGAGSKYLNAGTMTGQGVELDLRLTPVLEFGDFYWNVYANATFATSKVTELYGGLSELTVYDPIYAIVGQPFPYIKATDFKRDPEGRVIVDPVTGLPTLGDLVPVGQTEPSVRLGLSTEFAWKGLSLNATFEYRGGHVARFDSEYEMLFTGASYISAVAGRERFVFPNSVIEMTDENGEKYYVENTNITVNSGGKDFWTGVYRSARAAQVVSANSWKLRELSLTWNLPQRWMEKTKILQSAAVSLVGRNLFYWVPDTNLWGDPDMWGGTGNRNAPGVVRNAMAGFRTFGFNINLSF